MSSLRTDRPERMLRRANPYHDAGTMQSLDERAERDYRRILSSVPAPATSAPRLRNLHVGRRQHGLQRPAMVIGALGSVTALAVGLVAGTGLFSNTAPRAYAATPALLVIHSAANRGGGIAAAPTLRRFAHLADQQPWSAGRFTYVKYRSWSLNVAASDGSVATAVDPTTTQAWRASDDSGRLVQSSQPAESATGGEIANRQAASAAQPDIDTEQTEPYYAGQPDASALSTTDPQKLEAQLLDSDGSEPQGPIPTYLTALTQYQQYQPLPPALQANLWRLLASSGSFADLGTTVDRAGRHGDAIAYDTTAPSSAILPTRFLLVIDPKTGLLLDSERILTSDPGKLPVHIPAVIQYTVFLAAGNTSTDGTPPSP